MAKLLFNLRNVENDEAEDVFELLEQHNIDFYQTHGGSFGMSLPGIWVHDEVEYARARCLIDQYQHERQQRVKVHYRQLKACGQNDKLIRRLRRMPNRMITFTIAIIMILIVSIVPLLDMF